MSLSQKLTWLSSGFHSTRMLIGAVHVLYLTSLGVTLKQVAILQLVFSTTVLFFEFPTGVIADTLNHKYSVILGCFLTGLFYPFCLGAPDMRYLILSEIIYGIGLCLMSGAYEAWLVSAIKSEFPGNLGMINHFNHYQSEITALGFVFAAPVGASLVVFFHSEFKIVYVLSSFLMFLLAFLFWTVPGKARENSDPTLADYYKTITDSLAACLTQKSGLIFVSIGMLSVVINQPIFHFWQPYFINIFEKGAQSFGTGQQKPLLTGMVFFVFGLSQYVFNRIIRKNLIEIFDSLTIGIISASLSALMIAFMCIVPRTFLFLIVILFGLFRGLYSVVGVVYTAEYYRTAVQDRLASIISAKGVLERMSGIVALVWLSGIVTNRNLNLIFLSTIIPLLATIGLLLYWKFFKRRKACLAQ